MKLSAFFLKKSANSLFARVVQDSLQHDTSQDSLCFLKLGTTCKVAAPYGILSTLQILNNFMIEVFMIFIVGCKFWVLRNSSQQLCGNLLSKTIHQSVSTDNYEGHFTQEPRAVTMKLWEPKRKCPKAVPIHLQSHVLWSRTLKCSVKSFVTGPSAKCYFDEFLFMRVLTHDKNVINQRPWAFRVSWSPNGFVLGLPPRGGFWKQSKWPWNMASILHSHTPLVPQA